MPTLYDFQAPLDEPATLTHGCPREPCDRCRTLKVKCEFKPSVAYHATCKRCFNGGHDCTSVLYQKSRRVYTEPEDSQPPEIKDSSTEVSGPFPLKAPFNNAHLRSTRHPIYTNTNYDQGDVPYQSPTYGRLTADLAFNHVKLKGPDLVHTLGRYGYEGSYLVQAGFNPEFLRLGLGILQEIFIFLEFELDPAVAKKLAAVLDPFPVTIHDPEESRYVPSPSGNESILDIWMLRGIYRQSVPSQATAPMGDNKLQEITISDKNDGSDGQNDQGDEEMGNTPPNSTKNSSGGSGGGVNIPNYNPKQIRTISIPFSSTLTFVEDRINSAAEFKTNACVEVRIEENFRSQSPPEGLNWGGPWFEARMTLLDAEIQTAPTRKPEYHLSFSQIRFIASRSPSYILSFSPPIVRAEEDNIKSKAKRSTPGRIQGVTSITPIHFEGTHDHTSGEEQVEKRWEIVGCCVPSDINDATGAPQSTTIWKYTHNTVNRTEAHNVFEPRPVATFGFSRTWKAKPSLEVEVVMCYSWFTPSQIFCGGFKGRSKLKNRPPAFLNFLHRTSVVIDFERVNESAEWNVGLTADERYLRKELEKAEDRTTTLLKQALHGRIDLTEEQRGVARLVLEFLKRSISGTFEETGEAHSQGMALRTPNTLEQERPLEAHNHRRSLNLKCNYKSPLDATRFNGDYDYTRTLLGACTEPNPKPQNTQQDRKSLQANTEPDTRLPKMEDLDIGASPPPPVKMQSERDHLWRLGPQSPDRINTNDDQKDAQYPQYSISRGQSITADLAFNHATLKRSDILCTLARYGYEGSYLVQVGFNPELLHLQQEILQEIFIFLEFKLDPMVAKELAALLDPFPVTIYDPQESRYVPSPPNNGGVLDFWKRRGIYRERIQSQATAPIDGGEPQKTTTNGAFLYKSGSGGRSGGWSGRGDKRGGSGTSDGSGRGSGGSGGAGGNTVNIPNYNLEQTGTREISIPFSSTLTWGEDRTSSATRFKTNACVEIKIEENHQCQSRPEGRLWGGPWFEARMAQLDAEILTVARKVEYHLTFSQIRFITSKIKNSLPILSFSPSIIRADEDSVKSKSERHTSGGIRGVISANPSLRFEGTRGHISGEERTQKRWEVVGHTFPSDKNASTGAPQTTMIWKYTHNSAFYSPEAQNVFEPRPAATFGLSRASEVKPCLEVEVVTCYSWFAPSQTFRDWFTGRSKSKNRPPAFLNFLHQTSVAIDLEKVNNSVEWMTGLDADEKYPAEKLGKAGKMTVRQLESSGGASDCYVSLQAALHGHIDLNEQQRSDARAVLESLNNRTSDTLEETGEASYSGIALPTPSPTPSPTSSIFSGTLNQSSDTLSKDMGSDMDVDEEPSVMSRTRLLQDDQVMSWSAL